MTGSSPANGQVDYDGLARAIRSGGDIQTPAPAWSMVRAIDSGIDGARQPTAYLNYSGDKTLQMAEAIALGDPLGPVDDGSRCAGLVVYPVQALYDASIDKTLLGLSFQAPTDELVHTPMHDRVIYSSSEA